MGLAGVVLFGALLMIHPSGMGDHTNCLPGLLGTSECKTNIGPLEYVRVHLGVLMGIITTIPTSVVWIALLGLMIFLYVTGIFSSQEASSLQKWHFSVGELEAPRIQGKLLEWASLHEKRDPSSVFAAST